MGKMIYKKSDITCLDTHRVNYLVKNKIQYKNIQVNKNHFSEIWFSSKK